MDKTIFTFEKLYRAYLDCRKNKRKTKNALKFEMNLERNLFQLQKELKNKTYKPGRSICFVVTEPCPREIFAAEFKDRVVHHLLIREINNIGEKVFIFDSFSCRKDKGTHSAVKRLRNFIGKTTKNYKERAYCLKLDVSGFFMAINHDVLYMVLKNLISKQNRSYQWKNDILWLAKIIIFYKPNKNYITKGDKSLFKLIPPRKSLFNSAQNKGLPIGNYSSQFFANLYLNELDQFIKRYLKCKYYVRYVDDLIILNKDNKKLKYFKNKINRFLKNKLDLELNLNKTKLQGIYKGIEFLGYFVKLDYVLVKRRVISRFKNKLFLLNKNTKIKKSLAMINSYYGHFKYSFSYNLRKSIYENKMTINFSEIFLSKNNYAFLIIRNS